VLHIVRIEYLIILKMTMVVILILFLIPVHGIILLRAVPNLL